VRYVNWSFICYLAVVTVHIGITAVFMQVNKLVSAGAQILSPVAVGPQKNIGTVVDYAMHIYNQVYDLIWQTVWISAVVSSMLRVCIVIIVQRNNTQ